MVKNSILFQSLFSWNLFLMPTSGKTMLKLTPLFQSLFSWNLFLMSGELMELSEGLKVSILVFVELVLDDLVSPFPQSSRYEFQSLFSWNLFLMLAALPGFRAVWHVSILVFVELVLDERTGADRRKTPASFNPCFRGTCS